MALFGLGYAEWQSAAVLLRAAGHSRTARRLALAGGCSTELAQLAVPTDPKDLATDYNATQSRNLNHIIKNDHWHGTSDQLDQPSQAVRDSQQPVISRWPMGRHRHRHRHRHRRPAQGTTAGRHRHRPGTGPAPLLECHYSVD
jgi:hypothetical protein